MDAPDATARTGGPFPAFILFDGDGDGLISAADITGFIRGLGLQFSAQDAEYFVAAADADGDGLVTEAEFDAVRGREQVPGGVTPDQDAFAAFDVDGDGFISAAELQAAATHLGLTPQEATTMLTTADADADGKLSLAEFVAFLNS
jgi:Ca2+-binding EF-hand superfamily protein